MATAGLPHQQRGRCEEEEKDSKMSSSRPLGRPPASEVLLAEPDQTFLTSLDGFIQREERYLQGPAGGAHELRYLIHRSVFNKVIGRSSTSKRLLLLLKSEYDDTIREMKRRIEEEDECQTESPETCRISVRHRETEDIEEKVGRRRCREPSPWTPGLTVVQHEDLETLQSILEEQEACRGALQDTQRHSAPPGFQTQPVAVQTRPVAVQTQPVAVQTRPVAVQTRPVAVQTGANKVGSGVEEEELQEVRSLRDHLKTEEQQLRQICKRLRFVLHNLNNWEELEELEEEEEVEVEEEEEEKEKEEEEVVVPLEELMTSMLESTDQTGGGVPPVLLFFEALLRSVSVGDSLSSAVSLQGVYTALQHSALQTLVHAVSQDKITFSEELGDVLSVTAQKFPPAASDLCLALACNVYESLGLKRKLSVSLCRRGLTHSAALLMKHSQDLTAEDCLWVFRDSPSLLLLQLLTEPRGDRPAVLPVGATCAALLVDPEHQQVALQLLDGFVGQGAGALAKVILEDSASSIDNWIVVASLCFELHRSHLSQVVRSVLLDQSGTAALKPDLEGARLMEHILL